jgi:hypothetical protein
MPLPSSTVMTPSLPTLSMASAIMSPISLVVVGGDGADLGDLLLAALTCLEMLLDRFGDDGGRPCRCRA